MGKRILVADDEANVIIALEFLLKREGFEVIVARNGAEALLRIRAERPDLAVLDILMPHKDGFQVCEEVRADPELKAIRILILTARERDRDMRKGLALGADAYMAKPFWTKELVATIRSLT